MSATTHVAVLTPPSAGAIATIEAAGPYVWELVRQLFRPAGKPLPESPVVNRFWFGTLGEDARDEVILAAVATDRIEVHCHGGPRVVRWIVDQFLAHGGMEVSAGGLTHPARLLVHAPTLRTAAILLNQLDGAFVRAVERILASPSLAGLEELARLAPVGRHLVAPWQVVIAGAPNVGKSSLVNALAGFQRAVVSEIAGTTRDLVSVSLALDGWPVEVTDTAGLRDAAGLEAVGVERARQALTEADLVLWVIDGSVASLLDPRASDTAIAPGSLLVINKCDLPAAIESDKGIRISATAGTGMAGLIAAMVARLVPVPPVPGAAVPYSPVLADLVTAAHTALTAGRNDDAARLLRDCLPAR